MISLVRGPGGLFKRLADEMVPGAVAIAAGADLLPFLSPLYAALAGAATWPLASAVIRAIRRRKWLRRGYRLAVFALVVFWSVHGVQATHLAPAGPVGAVETARWSRDADLLAGYGTAPFALPEHTTLAGWGSRPRRIRLPAFGGGGVIGRWSQAWMAEPRGGAPRIPMFRAPDPDAPPGALGARAVVLRPADASVGPPAAIVRLDLVTSDAHLHAAVAAAVADLGFVAQTVLVSATHTHSGPGGYSDVPLSALLGTDHFRADVFEAVTAAAVRAVRAAYEAAEPAPLALVRARDRKDGAPVLGRNRRAPDPTAIDDRVYVLLLESVASKRPIACVLNYAVHPVLYRRRHMAFERDLAGGLEESLSAALGEDTPVLFVNGAQGDVGPTPATHGQVSEEIAALGKAFAAVVAPAVEAARGTGATRWRLSCSRAPRDMGTPRVVTRLLGEREGAVEAVSRPYFDGDVEEVVRDVLALPVNVGVWSMGITEGRLGFTWGGDVGAEVNLASHMPSREVAFGAWVLAPEAGSTQPAFGLLWEPGEAVVELGRAWRDAAAQRGLDDVLVVGLTNGACAYLTPEATYLHDGYEAQATFFGPRTARHATETLDAALDAALRQLR